MKTVFSVFLFLFIMEGVFGVDPDKVKTVIEGDSVTLQNDFTEMQKDGIIEWIVNNTNIAKIDKGTGEVKYNDDKLMVMFSDRLNLDEAGFLTIWNIRIKHSGQYKVGSISSAGTKSKMFNVIVKESPLKFIEDKYEIKAVSVTKGSSETLHTETELTKHDLILWRFGAEGSLIAKGDTEDKHTSYYDDRRFRGRLELDSKTGSLTIKDLETEHTGEFRLKIISDRRILFKRFIVTVSVPGLSTSVIAGICAIVLLLVAAAVTSGVVIYFRRKISKIKKLIPELSEQLKQLSKISEQLEQFSRFSKKLSEINKKELGKVAVSKNKQTKLSEHLKKISEGFKEELPKISKQLEKLHEENIPERLCEISEDLKRMYEENIPDRLYSPRSEQMFLFEDAGIYTHCSTDVKISEQETYADVTQEETQRSEISESEGEHIIYVQETAISKVFGNDKRLRDRQGRKSLVIRTDNTEDPAVQTHGTDEKNPGN